MKLMRIFLPLVIILLLPLLAFSYPIQPQMLRSLCENSDLIVVASVGPTIDLPQPDIGYNSSKVELKIERVLKGDLQQSAIEVHYSPKVSCPSPPEYRAGTVIIAFLRTYPNQSFFITQSESYGTKNLSAGDREVYITRIHEMLDIMQMKDKQQRERETVEWLVRCIESPATRLEGAHDLHYSINNPNDKADNQQNFKKYLTAQHYSHMTDLLLHAEHFNRGEYTLLKLLKDKKNPGFAVAIISYLHTLDNMENSDSVTIDQYSLTQELMEWLAYQKDQPAVLEVYNRYDEFLDYEPESNYQRKQLLKEFLVLIER